MCWCSKHFNIKMLCIFVCFSGHISFGWRMMFYIHYHNYLLFFTKREQVNVYSWVSENLPNINNYITIINIQQLLLQLFIYVDMLFLLFLKIYMSAVMSRRQYKHEGSHWSLSPCFSRHWPEPSASPKSISDGQGKWHQDLCHLRQWRGHQVSLRYNWYRWRCFVHLHGVSEVYHRPKCGLWRVVLEHNNSAFSAKAAQMSTDITLATLRRLREMSLWSINVLHLVSAACLRCFAFRLYCNAKPLFVKKKNKKQSFSHLLAHFSFVAVRCSSLSWNGLGRFPTITKSFFCKELSCQTAAEQHPLRCPLAGAALLSYSHNNEPLSPSLHYTNPQIAFFEHCKVKGTPACAAGVCCFWLCHMFRWLCVAKVRNVWGPNPVWVFKMTACEQENTVKLKRFYQLLYFK